MDYYTLRELWIAGIEFCTITENTIHILMQLTVRGLNTPIYKYTPIKNSENIISGNNSIRYKNSSEAASNIAFTIIIKRNISIYIGSTNDSCKLIVVNDYRIYQNECKSIDNIINLQNYFVTKKLNIISNIVRTRYKWSSGETKNIFKMIETYCITDRLSISERQLEFTNIIKILSSSTTKYWFKVIKTDVFVLTKQLKYHLCEMISTLGYKHTLNIKLNDLAHSGVYMIYVIMCIKRIGMKIPKKTLSIIYSYL